MALWRATRGRALERRREQEAQSRLCWESYSRSLARAAICCSAQARWSAPRGASGPSPVRRQAAERLEQRRERLRELLSDERDALEAELRAGGGTEPEGERERCAELRAAREERRRRVAERLLHQHWKQNCAELREVESELHKKSVVESWGEQLKQKQQQGATEQEERKLYENEYEIARREALERIRQEEEKRRLENKKQAEMLLQQIEELKLREAEATKLKKEQENLLKQQWELESLEEERKQMEEHRKKTELGRFLRHQCDAQLKRRAQQIQEELVLAGRQRQIQEKMELNRQAQEESIKQREQLIKELEEARELTRREKEQEKELKTARRQELEAQLTERRLQEQEEQERQREEEEEERSNKQRCAELVQQEARSMAEQGYCSR
ncbi:trichoplein keratin filament-binding protein isoform X3 [Lagopus muta]|uniref:trichoplein keratin filament-binding protein isoform X3 n=1 Tax=Lagopus muta TaxID=64668 RepID=UPI00209DDB47|nr:trichoplein keratin filament-binding protein isoform X3 [Lagopus muta]